MPIAVTLTGKGLKHLINVKAGGENSNKKQPDASLKIEAEKSQIDIMNLDANKARFPFGMS